MVVAPTTEPDPPDYRQELVARPETLAIMRRIVSAHLDLWDLRELSDAATLCAHELLTNVMRHTGSPLCTITLRRRPDGVRVTVSDSDTEPPERRDPEWSEESGRGVQLIAALAAQCGTVTRRDGKDVWADIRTTTTSAYAT
ncbi:ATP-binding protein [Streptomyces pakalii]|uniref:ATP-binding protein n=1 Tax=Streptomyces pakalii TaxID=3036494 RepID=A0ABT7DGC4_9ACTN|nr:ATP-binding protein [Streptomyces pakalii]MDJ1644723.1 ATP-binding protein [Streptomyces pakalii]